MTAGRPEMHTIRTALGSFFLYSYGKFMMKRPKLFLNNPQAPWLNKPLTEAQQKKAFLVISCMIYVCHKVTLGHSIHSKIKDLFKKNAL